MGASHQTGWTALVTKMIHELSLQQKANDATQVKAAQAVSNRKFHKQKAPGTHRGLFAALV